MTSFTDAIAMLLLALCLPGSVYLALLTFAGSLPARRPAPGQLSGRLAIVVPAHDEALGIRRTLDNLLALAAVDGNTEVVVVADNCTDDTAAIAAGMGARVLQRDDPARRGKGYALDHAFTCLQPERHAAYLVIDADSTASANLLACVRQHFGSGAMALQTRYGVRNGDATARTRLAEIALAGFNVLRPRGRARLNWSAGLLGNGFALRREALERLPYGATSVVEDLEYHHTLVAAGMSVAFVDAAEVRGDMPTTARGGDTQRTRWEGGRLRMLREQGPALARAVLAGNGRCAEPLAELLLMPLAQHLMCLLAALVLATLGGSPPLQLAAGGGIAILVWHVVAALRVAGLPWRRLTALASLPGYLGWKLRLITRTLAAAAGNSAWTRTERTQRTPS